MKSEDVRIGMKVVPHSKSARLPETIPLVYVAGPSARLPETIPLVYVAGPYSSDSIEGVKENIRLGFELSASILRDFLVGVISPWLDWDMYVYGMIPAEKLMLSNTAALVRSDMMVIQPVGWEQSNGTLAEIECAEKRGIPVLFGYDEFAKWVHDKGSAWKL